MVQEASDEHVTRLPASELRRLPGGRGKDLVVEGSATVRGLDLSGMRWQHLRLHDAQPSVNAVLPQRLRRQRGLLVFEDCSFDGLRVRHFQPWHARFLRCSFRDVEIGYMAGGGHFVDCVFTGEWNGNFSARTLAGDSVARTVLTGNDFRGVSGIAFYGGVPWWANRFDLGGRHVLIRRDGPGWDAVVAAAAHDPRLADTVSSLQGQGPMGLDQDWYLEDRQFSSAATWQLLLEHCVAPGDTDWPRRATS